MKTVKILCGGCSYTHVDANGNKKRRAVAYRGELVSVLEEEAVRLVSLGAAAYADTPTEAPNTPPAPPSDSDKPKSEYQDTPDTEPPAEPDAEGGKSDTYAAQVKRLERMLKDDLVQMAQDMGVDISNAKNNHERAELLAAAMASEDDEEDEGEDNPPELEDEDIVR